MIFKTSFYLLWGSFYETFIDLNCLFCKIKSVGGKDSRFLKIDCLTLIEILT